MKIKTLYLIVFCLLLVCYNCNRNKQSSILSEKKLDKEKVYIVFRGTDTKEGSIAKEFNLNNTILTHVGFLVFHNDEWNVVHILNSDKKSDLQSEKLNSFFNTKKEQLFHASIWSINNLNNKQDKDLRMELLAYNDSIIKFDRYFDIEDTTKLYCSQFVINVLKKIDSQKFTFKPHKVKLKGFYRLY